MNCFDNAIQQDPNYVDAYYNKGLYIVLTSFRNLIRSIIII